MKIEETITEEESSFNQTLAKVMKYYATSRL
jgi:hypothetical protein